jgi:hypothetical protein
MSASTPHCDVVVSAGKDRKEYGLCSVVVEGHGPDVFHDEGDSDCIVPCIVSGSNLLGVIKILALIGEGINPVTNESAGIE